MPGVYRDLVFVFMDIYGYVEGDGLGSTEVDLSCQVS